MHLKKAKEFFEKALSFDAKIGDTTKSESMQRMAAKAVDKYLDKAAEEESYGINSGEHWGEAISL